MHEDTSHTHSRKCYADARLNIQSFGQIQLERVQIYEALLVAVCEAQRGLPYLVYAQW